MIDFDFVSPTKIYFGKGKERFCGEICNTFEMRNILLIYGSSRIENNGLLQIITKSLNEKGVNFTVFKGIRPNPNIADVKKALEIARKNKIDGILAVGGGSVIDSAKLIGVAYFYDGDPFDFNLKKTQAVRSLPLGVVLTISSAGSELSNSCVIQDDEKKIKAGFNSDIIRPSFVVENPELTFTTPAYQTAAAGSDIIMHSLERYFAPSSKSQLCDDWALDLIFQVMEETKVALKDPTNYEARANLMLASSLSHNGITNIGKPFGFSVHPLEHALSGYLPSITHGAGVALLYPAWATHVYKNDLHKFAKLAERLFKISDVSLEEKAIIGIKKMKEYFISIGMPSSLKEVGLSKKDIPSLVNLATGNGTRVIGLYPQSLDQQDVEEIYSALLS